MPNDLLWVGLCSWSRIRFGVADRRRYLDNPEATISAFDEDGYYKTGDFARWVNGEYILTGRDSECMFGKRKKMIRNSLIFRHIVVRYYGHKVSMYEVEARICKLPSVAEAYALAVPVTNNAYTEQRVGVIVRPKPTSQRESKSLCRDCDITLENLRQELSADLPFHMLPTVLRVIGKEEQIPKTVSEKVMRKEAVKRFFSPSGSKLSPEVERWDAECQVF